jgi:hypothetical protein
MHDDMHGVSIAGFKGPWQRLFGQHKQISFGRGIGLNDNLIALVLQGFLHHHEGQFTAVEAMTKNNTTGGGTKRPNTKN